MRKNYGHQAFPRHLALRSTLSTIIFSSRHRHWFVLMVWTGRVHLLGDAKTGVSYHFACMCIPSLNGTFRGGGLCVELPPTKQRRQTWLTLYIECNLATKSNRQQQHHKGLCGRKTNLSQRQAAAQNCGNMRFLPKLWFHFIRVPRHFLRVTSSVNEG